MQCAETWTATQIGALPTNAESGLSSFLTPSLMRASSSGALHDLPRLNTSTQMQGTLPTPPLSAGVRAARRDSVGGERTCTPTQGSGSRDNGRALVPLPRQVPAESHQQQQMQMQVLAGRGQGAGVLNHAEMQTQVHRAHAQAQVHAQQAHLHLQHAQDLHRRQLYTGDRAGPSGHGHSQYGQYAPPAPQNGQAPAMHPQVQGFAHRPMLHPQSVNAERMQGYPGAPQVQGYRDPNPSPSNLLSHSGTSHLHGPQLQLQLPPYNVHVPTAAHNVQGGQPVPGQGQVQGQVRERRATQPPPTSAPASASASAPATPRNAPTPMPTPAPEQTQAQGRPASGLPPVVLQPTQWNPAVHARETMRGMANKFVTLAQDAERVLADGLGRVKTVYDAREVLALRAMNAQLAQRDAGMAQASRAIEVWKGECARVGEERVRLWQENVRLKEVVARMAIAENEREKRKGQGGGGADGLAGATTEEQRNRLIGEAFAQAREEFEKRVALEKQLFAIKARIQMMLPTQPPSTPLDTSGPQTGVDATPSVPDTLIARILGQHTPTGAAAGDTADESRTRSRHATPSNVGLATPLATPQSQHSSMDVDAQPAPAPASRSVIDLTDDADAPASPAEAQARVMIPLGDLDDAGDIVRKRRGASIFVEFRKRRRLLVNHTVPGAISPGPDGEEDAAEALPVGDRVGDAAVPSVSPAAALPPDAAAVEEEVDRTLVDVEMQHEDMPANGELKVATEDHDEIDVERTEEAAASETAVKKELEGEKEEMADVVKKEEEPTEASVPPKEKTSPDVDMAPPPSEHGPPPGVAPSAERTASTERDIDAALFTYPQSRTRTPSPQRHPTLISASHPTEAPRCPSEHATPTSSSSSSPSPSSSTSSPLSHDSRATQATSVSSAPDCIPPQPADCSQETEGTVASMPVEPAAAHRESTPPRSASRQTTPAFASLQTKQAASEERPPSTQPARSPPPRKQLSIQHLPLIYQASGGRQLCRMCRERKKKINLSLPVTTFPLDATWSELADHVREMHPSGHDRLVAMSPKEIQEMKLRLQ